MSAAEKHVHQVAIELGDKISEYTIKSATRGENAQEAMMNTIAFMCGFFYSNGITGADISKIATETWQDYEKRKLN